MTKTMKKVAPSEGTVLRIEELKSAQGGFGDVGDWPPIKKSGGGTGGGGGGGW